MNTVRPATLFCRDRLGAVSAVMGLALLAACDSPRVAVAAETTSAIPVEKIDSICDIELSYDVTGPYYQSCRNYLRRHFQAQPVAVHPDEPAEHRACEQIGLAKDTPDYKSCVQELYQLDVSNAHL
jgi:hypothetical protein